MTPWIILGIALLGAAFALYRGYAKRRRRRALLASALTAEQRATVEKLVPLVRRLPEPTRAALEGKINLFLDQIIDRLLIFFAGVTLAGKNVVNHRR